MDGGGLVMEGVGGRDGAEETMGCCCCVVAFGDGGDVAVVVIGIGGGGCGRFDEDGAG